VPQDDYPDVWACDSEQKRTRVDVRTVELTDNLTSNIDINALQSSIVVESEQEIVELNGTLKETSDSDESVKITIGDFTETLTENETYEYTLDDVYQFMAERGLDVNRYFVTIPEVFGEASNEWIQIPTASVELWETRDNAAAINRTANVVFPNSWGSEDGNVTNSTLDIINETSSDDPIQQARVLFRDDADSEWVIKHLGFISGVGGTDNPLESQMWIYDYSQLISNAPLTATYNDENAKRVVSDIANRIRNETPTPLSDLHIRLEDAQQPLEADFAIEDTVLGSVINEQRFGSNDPFVSATAVDIDGVGRAAVDGIQFVTIDSPLVDIITGDTQSLSQTTDTTIGAITDPIDAAAEVFNLDQKHFTRNRDTIGDALEWFAKNVSAQWWFEPLPDGDSIALIIDINIVRQTYCHVGGYDELATILDAESVGQLQNGTESTRVIQNRALDEINPINTLRLNGSTGKSFKGELFEGDVVPAARSLVGQPATNTYPYVKVRAPRLYEAADGNEVQPNAIDSDVESKAAAEGEARKELLERLTRPSNGEIDLYGTATMRPYDTLYAYQTCGDYIDTTQPLIAYTVSEVKHEQKNGNTYRTKVTPSLKITENDIEVVESRMENIN